LPLFRSGVPVVGDVQVMENQIGSSVNLTSFKRLDLERPLDPQYLVNFLSVEDQQKYTEQERDKLDSMNVKVLTVIGNPFNTMNPFKKPEDDGLVKCYSANLNHIYLDDGDGKEDIGYKKAQVRQVNVGHHQMTEVTNRNQQQYKYVVSYLTDNLIPQKDPAQYTVKNFLVIARVYPEYIDYVKNPSMCFRTGAEIYYTKDERYELPKINIHAIAKSPKNEALKTENAYVYRVSSNIVSGVIFFEGNVSDPTKSGYAVFEIKAKGYKTKYVRLKVAGGEVTYAPNLLMEKE